MFETMSFNFYGELSKLESNPHLLKKRNVNKLIFCLLLISKISHLNLYKIQSTRNRITKTYKNNEIIKLLLFGKV